MASDRDERLHAAIERARESPFYRKHLAGETVGSRDDLARLPLTHKIHLQKASPYGLLRVPPQRAWHYHETSGTTGEPVSTWCGLVELRQMAEFVHGLVPELHHETMLLNRFPLFAPVAFVFEEALRLAGACHIAAGTMSWDVPFDRALDFMRRLPVTALATLPLEPILLRELARTLDVDIARELAKLELVFCGGAVLPPAMRRVIAKDWHARVAEIYGSNETMLLGTSCTENNLHLATDLVEVEVLDPETKERVPDGEPGVLTVTSLVHEVMPLVRYFNGDLVRIAPEPCPCGRPEPVAQVFGRFDDVIRFGERTTTPFDILDAAYDFVDALDTRLFFVVVQKRKLHFLIELPEGESERAFDDTKEGPLRERLGVPIEVEYLRFNEVMDRTALFRGPKIYKPSQIANWRTDERKVITIMEALLEWPKFDRKTLVQLGLRQFRNSRRRGRLAKEDREA